jgi:hypothetical protein
MKPSNFIHDLNIMAAFGNGCCTCVFKKFNFFFLLKINFFLHVLNCFDVLILKIIF